MGKMRILGSVFILSVRAEGWLGKAIIKTRRERTGGRDWESAESEGEKAPSSGDDSQ